MSTSRTTIFVTALTQALTAAQRQQRLCRQAADTLDAADLHVIAHAFRFTAAQEAEHAAILRSLLKDAPLPPQEDVILPDEADAMLRTAIDGESACFGVLLPEAARAAAQADQSRIAAALLRIAENDRRHDRRFRQYLHALRDGTLLHSDAPTSWFCLPCGCLHHGCDAPAACDSCGATRSHFIRSSFHPFALT